MPTWSPKDACRCERSGLPYWPRLKLYMNDAYVAFDNVQLAANVVRQAVGSPSFTAGKCAARIGCVAKGVTPTTSAARQASSSFHLNNTVGRRTMTARATAGAGSIPAM